jgi:hypothetical protein
MVRGAARITRNNETFLLAENESTTQNERDRRIVRGRRGIPSKRGEEKMLGSQRNRRELCALQRTDVENILIFQDLDMAAVLAAWFLYLGMLPRIAAANVAAWCLERASRPPGSVVASSGGFVP